MIRFLTLLPVCGILVLLVIAVAPKNSAAQAFAFAKSDTVIELEDLLSVSDIAVHGNVIYALDGQEKKIFKYSMDGELLGSIGREGAGPGEFSRPRRISFFNNQMFILDSPTKVHVFDSDETFSHAIRAAGIFGTSQAILSNSSIVIGGSRIDQGTLAHVFSMEGDLINDFMPVSPLVKKYGADMILGTHCDSGGGLTVWCVDTSDYAVKEFDAEGRLLRSFDVRPPGFIPMHSQAPELRSGGFAEWTASWDSIRGLYSLTDEILMIHRVINLRGQVVDLIRKDSGAVLASHAIEGRVGFVDTEQEIVYFILPATEEPSTTLRIISIDDLLP